MKSIKKHFDSTTKVLVWAILLHSFFWIDVSCVLAYFDRNNPLENLSVTLVKEIIAVILVYAVKSFFETYEQKKNEITLEEMKNAKGIKEADKP